MLTAGLSRDLVQVVSGRVYVHAPNEAQHDLAKFLRSRRDEAVDMIDRLVATSTCEDTRKAYVGAGLPPPAPGSACAFPDVELVLCPDDCVISQDPASPLRLAVRANPRDFADPIPAFTHVACQDSVNIPFPFWHHGRTGRFVHWDEYTAQLAQNRERYPPWRERQHAAVFRGAARRCYAPWRGEVLPSAETWQECGRTRLKYLAHADAALRTWLDVDVGDMPYADPQHFPRGSPHAIPMTEQERFQFALNVEGNCGWADRLMQQVFMGPVIINQETMCKEWYGLLMQPWVHYIPTDYYFHTLADVLAWAELRPADAERLAQNAQAFARGVLSQRGIEAYVRRLLVAYSALLRYDVAVRPGAELAAAYRQRMAGLPQQLRIAVHEVREFTKGFVPPTYVLVVALAAVALLLIRHRVLRASWLARLPGGAVDRRRWE